MLFVQIAGIALGFPLLAWSFGWTVLGRLDGLDREERFAAAWGVGIAFLAAAQFVAFLIQAPQPAFQVAVAALMLAGVLLFRLRGQKVPASAGAWKLALWPALAYAELLCIQARLPQYVGSDWWGDWCMHYQAALVFAGKLGVDWKWIGTYTIASRTPLFNLAAAFVLGLAGSDFWVFQVAATALNCCFVMAVYLVLRDLFGPRTAQLGLLLAPLNLWMLHEAWFTWPKMLAAYFVLLSLHFYLRWLRSRQTEPAAAPRLLLACWVSGLLGFLTHQVAAVYLGALVLHGIVMAWRQRALRPHLREAALPAAVAVLLAGPWYLWLAGRFGIGSVIHGTPVTLMERPEVEEDLATRTQKCLGAAGHNLAASVVPVLLEQTLRRGPWTADEFYRRATEFYFSLLTGALTVSLTVFLVFGLLRALTRLRRAELRTRLCGPEGSAVWSFVLIGTLAATALHPAASDHGIAHAAFFPSTVLLTALAWGVLSRAPRPARVVVAAGMLAEFAGMFWSHVWLVAWPELLDPKNINVYEKYHNGIVFLSDLLAPGQSFVIGALVLIQLTLAFLLIWLLLRETQEPGPVSPAENGRPG